MLSEQDQDERQKRIRERAYEIWEEEGRPQGRSDTHWWRASEEFEQAADNEVAADTAPASLEPPSTAEQTKQVAPKKTTRRPRRSP